MMRASLGNIASIHLSSFNRKYLLITKRWYDANTIGREFHILSFRYQQSSQQATEHLPQEQKQQRRQLNQKQLEGHNTHPLQQGSKQLLGKKQEKQVGQEESDSFSDIQELLLQKDKKTRTTTAEASRRIATTEETRRHTTTRKKSL